jgi:hypothetical protein
LQLACGDGHGLVTLVCNHLSTILAIRHADEARMSVECSMLAIGAARHEALRGNPRAVTDEVILRKALGHLAGMSFLKQNMSEAEVLAEISFCASRLSSSTRQGRATECSFG